LTALPRWLSIVVGALIVIGCVVAIGAAKR
jgi:hypothetical protein